MAGSQLTQLKTALTSAGLNRKTASKKDKKTWKKGGARETDRGKTLAKLEDIRKNLNKFDQKETRVKHVVGGRNLKGVTGRPSASKQAGLEQRRKTLLPEHQLRGHTGTFRDRRFGESDPSMSVEDKMLERYTRERQRGQGRKGMFNLEDEDDLGLEGFDDGNALGALTHGGRSVSDLPGDDFMAQGLGDDDEDDELDEDERRGRIDRRQVDRGHFGGFDEEELPERKKSKAEVMSEIIAKSKDYKLERQKQKDMDDDLREALDDDLDGLRELLTAAPVDGKALPGPSRPKKPIEAGDDKEYDQFVRTLAYEARAKPKDRTKTEDELAVEEAEELQKAEAKRLRRMRGEDVSDEDAEEGGGGYRKRRKLERRGDADDLDDDFEEDLLGPGITREDFENMGAAQNGEDDEESEEEDMGSSMSGSDDGEDEEDDDEDADEDEIEDEDSDDEDVMSVMEDLDEAPELVPVDSDEEQVVKRSKGKKAKTTKEIPFTFPCPASIEEFEDILEQLDDSALPIVVQRIRAIHHPSLAQGNKEKLQEFLGVLIDYVLILASRPEPAFDLISSLNPHLVALVKLNPVTASSHFISKITLMQRNLSRGLGRGASRRESKTLPGCAELVLLRFVGLIWSTSDYSNPVVVPAVLLMGQYLAQSSVRNVRDVASGLFICSILSQYESLSKRLLPEAVNFVASSLLLLLPRRKDAATVAYPDISDVDLRLTSAVSPTEPVDLARALNGDGSDAVKADLVVIALRLTQTFATMYASHEAFIEIIKPVLLVIEGSKLPKDSSLKTIHGSVQEALRRMLGFAQTSRMPLAMQAHKPIPIRSFAPKFEDDFAPGKHYDPDAERNASNKLKSLYKKERKGAIRELRKDNRFLAGEKAREQAEKDASYTAKMRRVEGAIQVERAEEKDMQREKERQKRRAGRG